MTVDGGVASALVPPVQFDIQWLGDHKGGVMDDLHTNPIKIGQVWDSAWNASVIEVIGGSAGRWHVVVMRHGEPTAVVTLPWSTIEAGYLLVDDA